MSTTYDDGMVRVDDEGLTLRRYYFPTFQAKHVAWSELREVTSEDARWFHGRGRLWGSSVPLTRWLPLDVHRSRREALIVLDVVLPDGDGLAFLVELKAAETTRAIPVLLLSGESAGPYAAADARIAKPYDVAHLVTQARALVRHGKKRRRVLIIDDSPTYRNQVKEALTVAGYDVYEATTGEEGLVLVSTVRPDAIVVDGVLPGIDGATVVRRLKLDSWWPPQSQATVLRRGILNCHQAVCEMVLLPL